MTALKCDICGGKLIMEAGGVSTCDSCGMSYSSDRIKEMVQEIKGSVSVSNIASVDSLMKRGWLFLGDKDWSQADGCFDRVLDISPEYANAYVGKLCVEYKIAEEDMLYNRKHISEMSKSQNYIKANRFASGELATALANIDASLISEHNIFFGAVSHIGNTREQGKYLLAAEINLGFGRRTSYFLPQEHSLKVEDKFWCFFEQSGWRITKDLFVKGKIYVLYGDEILVFDDVYSVPIGAKLLLTPEQNLQYEQEKDRLRVANAQDAKKEEQLRIETEKWMRLMQSQYKKRFITNYEGLFYVIAGFLAVIAVAMILLSADEFELILLVPALATAIPLGYIFFAWHDNYAGTEVLQFIIFLVILAVTAGTSIVYIAEVSNVPYAIIIGALVLTSYSHLI